MPEGHTVARSANHFNKHFAGQITLVTSPQGRFTDSVVLDKRELSEAISLGKQLFLRFQEDYLRIHLGIYGKWSHQSGPIFSEPVGQVRARFIVGQQLSDLRGPTICEVIDQDQFRAHLIRLGPDPLWPDLDGSLQDRFVSKAIKSNTAIGQLLMDQSVIAGIGNVYRAEILFRAGLNPFLAGNKVPETKLMEIWADSVQLLRLGVETGVMLTRENFQKLSVSKEDRYQVYKREGLECRVCGGVVSIALMASRKLYWCGSCQK
jgi:endonuclease VIII